MVILSICSVFIEGSRGSLLVSEGSVYHATIDRTVVPVDTTGAGDSFIGR